MLCRRIVVVYSMYRVIVFSVSLCSKVPNTATCVGGVLPIVCLITGTVCVTKSLTVFSVSMSRYKCNILMHSA
jgi:hypothetical protein